MSTPWWQPRAVLARFVADLLAGELARQRRGMPLRPLPWPEDLRLDEDLGVDSLERVALATALSEALHLHESGIEDYLLARHGLGDWVDVAATGLERFGERLTFRTSGSSGVPKPCPHTLATLGQETAHLASLFRGRRRVLCAVPSHHIYGFLFGVLLPRELGLAPDAVVDVRGRTPAWLLRSAEPGDLVVAYPEFWGAVARSMATMAPDVVGVTSTAPCPDDVARQVVVDGLARLVQVYGASETGGIGARDSCLDPYTLFPHWRVDPANPRWLLRALPGGGEQAFMPLDRCVPCDERHILVRGRRDQAVQVGGINVFPQRVREVLLRHPAVADAAVRLMGPGEGTRLKAFVVPARGRAADSGLLTELQHWMDRALTTPERPKAIRFGPSLPVGPTGKPADWPLPMEGVIRTGD